MTIPSYSQARQISQDAEIERQEAEENLKEMLSNG